MLPNRKEHLIMVIDSKREYLAKIKDRYRHVGKKYKSSILDEFCEVCGYHRKHAVRLLNKDGRNKKKKPGRPTKYGIEVVIPLENIWINSGYPCSSRLVKMIPLWLPFYEKQHGVLEDDVRRKVLTIKPRTLDNVLSPVRKKHGIRGLAGTKPGTYLKNSIPIKISHRDVFEPGYVQVDTVANCGGSLKGDFVWSLTMTDIYSGWTENGAVWNKGQHGVHQLLEVIEERIPFLLKGFHTDNGGEFINHHLYQFYKNRDTPVEITRGRPGRSNDNPHVEQKNYTHVRKLIGYQRIDDEGLIKVLNDLYELTGLMNNFFSANKKLVSKERHGAKYRKKYDKPMTPCQRLLESEHVTELQKTHLTELQINLDPYKLRKMIDAKRRKIFNSLR